MAVNNLQMISDGNFDVIVCGGGLSGLTTAALLAEQGFHVAVFEKKKYPSHKVCGEYLSREVEHLLHFLEIQPQLLGAPIVDRFHVRTRNDKEFTLPLEMGAWGISRFLLDECFANAASKKGVVLFQSEAVRAVRGAAGHFAVKTDKGLYSAKRVVGAYGKRDLLDKELKRDFLKNRTGYMAVKYHLRTEFKNNTVGLYPFSRGFAGVVNVEEGRTCLCYLMRRENMKGFRTIRDMEKKVLYENKVLEDLMENSTSLYEDPLVINEVGFSFKELYKDGIFYTGDSAAMIAPVCGNGMAMAIKGGMLLADAVALSLHDSTADAKKQYMEQWVDQFYSRLQTGRMIQSLLLNEPVLNPLIPLLKLFPFLSRGLIRSTHGKPLPALNIPQV